jgi:hypothetical protein
MDYRKRHAQTVAGSLSSARRGFIITVLLPLGRWAGFDAGRPG